MHVSMCVCVCVCVHTVPIKILNKSQGMDSDQIADQCKYGK